MIKFIKKYFNKNKSEKDLIKTIYELKEINRLLSRSLMRCSRDFSHAISFISLDERDMFEHRANIWRKIGNYPDGYRDELHQEINRLDSEVNRLKLLLKQNNIIV